MIFAAMRAIRRQLPSGASLPVDAWERRHRVVLVLLVLHASGLAVFALARGFGAAHALFEGGVPALVALVAASTALQRRWRAVVASAGLMTCSAILVHLSGGYIEAHFHFFVMLGVIALYEDWAPFLVSIAYVALHHGIVGTLDPASVYNHPDAFARPWAWALVHAIFVLGLSAAIVVAWRVAEEARARAQQVLDSAGEGILGLDAQGRIRFANPAAAALTGYSVGELVGKPGTDLVPAGAPREILLTRKDGARIPVEWVASALADAAGLVLVLRDVSERHRAAAELEEARRQVAMSEKLSALGTLVSGVAHEIRTPLTYVSNHLHFADLRMRRAARDDDAFAQRIMPLRESVEGALDGVDRINQLVEDLRRFTRLPTNERAPSRLHEVVREAVDLFEATHRGRVEVERDLAPTPLQPLDKAQVQQVVINLLENAVDAMPRGGRIVVATRATRDGAELDVRDQGDGIPPDVQARMFDPFYTTKPTGTGLGLSIVRRIVEAHGGAIACDSAAGHGTAFRVALPAPRSVAAPSAPSRS